MTRRVVLFVVVAPLVLSGCGPAQTEQKEPFKPSAPPAGWVEEREKLRAKGNQPGPPTTATTSN